jgi:hypothetical protein
VTTLSLYVTDLTILLAFVGSSICLPLTSSGLRSVRKSSVPDFVNYTNDAVLSAIHVEDATKQRSKRNVDNQNADEFFDKIVKDIQSPCQRHAVDLPVQTGDTVRKGQFNKTKLILKKLRKSVRFASRNFNKYFVVSILTDILS